MTLWDGLVALGVMGAFGFIILIQMAKKKPAIKEFIQSLSPLTQKIEGTPDSVTSQQIYPERRSMM